MGQDAVDVYLHELRIVLTVLVIGHFGLQSLCLGSKLLHKFFCELRNFLDLQSDAYISGLCTLP